MAHPFFSRKRRTFIHLKALASVKEFVSLKAFALCKAYTSLKSYFSLEILLFPRSYVPLQRHWSLAQRSASLKLRISPKPCALFEELYLSQSTSLPEPTNISEAMFLWRYQSLQRHSLRVTLGLFRQSHLSEATTLLGDACLSETMFL